VKRWLVSCWLVPCLALPLAACDDDDDIEYRRPHRDSGAEDAGEQEPGVCRLADCPQPDMGIACCTPSAECGMDPTGIGLACVPNPDVGSNRECVLDECPTPVIGNACCTPFAECGLDPFGTGVACFAYPPTINVDAGVIDVCDPTECPDPETGGFGCCLPNGECGVDPLGINLCFAPPVPLPPLEIDAGFELPPLQPLPPISTEPPDDPSITGECPSFLGFFGPVWGCCSDFGVCGTFAFDQCLIPVGTVIPVSSDEDAGTSSGYPLCTPPPAE
jgi:hypothetical protein